MGALDRKIALVTGAASGIGRASARRLREEGARICVVDVSPEGRTTAEELDGVFVQADVADPAQGTAMVDACVSQLGGLHVAHLNAGVACPEADPTALSDEDYRRTVGINVDGVVFGIRAVVPAMEESGGGSIVVTSSLAGLIGFPVDPVYAATKHAVVGYVRSLPEHLTPRGIRVNCVNPGIAKTSLVGDDVVADLEKAGFPLLEPGDVADAVVAILAGEGTGECWPVQPGREPEPYRFRRVPGPRTEGTAGMRPPRMPG